jgi:hypothetical protein
LQVVFEFLGVCGWLIYGQTVVKRLANAVRGRAVFEGRKLCSFWGFILGEDAERATAKTNTGILRFVQNDDEKQELQLQIQRRKQIAADDEQRNRQQKRQRQRQR